MRDGRREIKECFILFQQTTPPPAPSGTPSVQRQTKEICLYWTLSFRRRLTSPALSPPLQKNLSHVGYWFHVARRAARASAVNIRGGVAFQIVSAE